MRTLGLLGHPVAHSKSPELFQHFFTQAGCHDCEYLLFDFPKIEQLPELIFAHPNLRGFNVTVPHKQNITQFLHTISPEAQAIASVNTVLVKRNNNPSLLPFLNPVENPNKLINALTANGISLEGHNTDVLGFEKLLIHTINPSLIYGLATGLNQAAQTTSSAIILGNGGSANAVRWVLNHHNIRHTTVSRNSEQPSNHRLINLFDLPTHIKNHTLFIQTTPVGMWPNEMECLDIPMDCINETHTLIDLIYNPEETQLMRKFYQKGAKTMNGAVMLEAQAIASWELFQSNF